MELLVLKLGRPRKTGMAGHPKIGQTKQLKWHQLMSVFLFVCLFVCFAFLCKGMAVNISLQNFKRTLQQIGMNTLE